MKKPVALSLVVLALSLLHVAPAFADSSSPADAATADGASKPKKPRKVSRSPKSVKPSAKPKKAAVVAAAPETAAAEPVEAPPPAPIVAPAPDPAAKSVSAPAPMRDEPSASPHSESEDESKPIQLAPLVGYASQGLKLGFGARVSYTFTNHIAVAGTFVYHLGTSEDGVGIGGVAASSSVHVFYPGAEVGYDLHIDRVTIRPYAGAGVVFASVSTKVGDQESSDTKSRFAIYPGVTAHYEIPQTAFFAGADMRLLIVTDSDSDPSFGFFGTFGMRL